MQIQDNSEQPKQKRPRRPVTWNMPWWVVPLSFFLIEIYAFTVLILADGISSTEELWPLLFGALWAVALSGMVRLLPRKAARVAYAVGYAVSLIYAMVQTGYYLMFREMIWLSGFRYASEGAGYLDVLLGYPVWWWLETAAMIALGVLTVWRFPHRVCDWRRCVFALVLAVLAIFTAKQIPYLVFQHDQQVRFAETDYGRSQSAEAAYRNMFNAHRLYQVCGLYQTAAKDISSNIVRPLLPSYTATLNAKKSEIDDYFAKREAPQPNDMTGIFAGKNVVLVLMESMDDWAIGRHTPTLCRLMDEGINFTHFYTPGYGSVRTFNSEFCANTGTFLSSAGGYAFDYVTNHFDQSIASTLTRGGYTSAVYHYNSPDFYSRGVFEPAMGYGRYVSYEDYVTKQTVRELYDDQFLFNNADVAADFFRDGKRLNTIITRSAHMSYSYREGLSDWGLDKYPEYYGMTGDEEEDCMYLKARLVDDMFARLLSELEARGELENTVIVAFTDHYTYAFKDQELVMKRSRVDDPLLLEKTPCFIWSKDCPTVQVDKVCNTSDLLPTVLNLLGVQTDYQYIGHDAFDPSYEGYALFSNGSWVVNGAAYNAAEDKLIDLSGGKFTVTHAFAEEMTKKASEFVRINNLILETDYYRK